MHKNRLKMLLVGSLFSVGIFADPVVMINGSSVQKLASKVTFDGDNAVVKFTDGEMRTLDMESVLIEFSSTTGLPMTDVSFFSATTVVESSLLVSGLTIGSDLSIFSMDGKMLVSQKVNSTEFSYDVSDYKSDVYLLKIDNQVIKFIKK